MSSLLAYEAEEKDYDAPEQLERRQISSSLPNEAEKDEAGCSGMPARAEKEAECRHAPEKEADECPDHSPEEEAECRHAPEKEAECPDHSLEEEAVAECPYSPEASSSEG